MAYADSIRSATATWNTAASLIEGIFSSSYGLTWTSYTPTLGATGSMTWTTTTIDNAKYIRCGKLIILNVQAFGTTGGTASSGLTVSLPVTAANVHLGGACWVVDTAKVAGVVTQSSTSVIICQKYDASNFGLGASRYVNLVMAYEAA